MLLCVDIGNTNIVLGLHDGERWLAHWRIRTARDSMPDEYAVLLRGLLRDGGFRTDDIEQVILASVVPPLTGTFTELFDRYLNTAALVVGPGVRTGLRIRIDNPVELGADLVANAVAAYERFKGPCIVVDFGTATTFSAVSAEGDFLGVAIAPGLGVAAEALASRTAQLPRVGLTAPAAAIGKNTVQSMQSGLIYGYVGLVEGLVTRIQAELGGKAQVIATGGLGQILAPLTEHIGGFDQLLTLEGLRLIALRNSS
jgi:type III pantothenate kinase